MSIKRTSEHPCTRNDRENCTNVRMYECTNVESPKITTALLRHITDHLITRRKIRENTLGLGFLRVVFYFLLILMVFSTMIVISQK